VLSSPNFIKENWHLKLIRSAYLRFSGPYACWKGIPTMSLLDRANKHSQNIFIDRSMFLLG
jgi:hypothetical protein